MQRVNKVSIHTLTKIILLRKTLWTSMKERIVVTMENNGCSRRKPVDACYVGISLFIAHNTLIR